MYTASLLNVVNAIVAVVDEDDDEDDGASPVIDAIGLCGDADVIVAIINMLDEYWRTCSDDFCYYNNYYYYR